MSDKERAIDCARLNAPYLAESLDLFPEIPPRFVNSDPAYLFVELVDNLPVDIGGLDVEMKLLRQFKRKSHLIFALADIASVWSWVEVTEHLTQLADICMRRILLASGRAQGVEGDYVNPVPGLFILAVGKYGARELNYSSDVDFNVFYDPDKVVLPNPARAERTLIRLVQGLVRGMEAITEDGYIFRTDLRLRPDPRSNAVAVSTRTAERYYETVGQNWERAAMIKARCCAGDMEAGNDFIANVLSPFIWRRNLDYAAIEDILAIKRQIHSLNGGESLTVPGHHLKLGIGGIREIEFYAQVQQLILGGRNAELRSPRTVDALSLLAKFDFVTIKDADDLISHYGELRKLEHRAQMMEDAQTHFVPVDNQAREKVSTLSGYNDLSQFEEDLKYILMDVRRIYSELFPQASSLSSSVGNLVFTGVEPGPATMSALENLGYQRAAHVWSQMAAWLGGRIKATRSERARELLTALAPQIIEFCAETGKPDEAFQSFGGFFTRLNSGISLLSRFHQKPEQLKYLISLMVKSRHIAETIAMQPNILDALSDPAFLEIDESHLDAGAAIIGNAEDFEEAMNAARRWAREEQFRLSAAILSSRLAPIKAGPLFARLAECVIRELLPFAIKEAERKTGPISGSVGVIGLGKLGSRELSLTSDLDLMLIYQPEGNDNNVQHVFTKITQRLISALSAVTEEGELYEVDMALRPSGRAGPVAVSMDAFLRYYGEKAWSWEFMALSRSRVICASSREFFCQLNRARSEALLSVRPDLNIDTDIEDMLKRVRDEKPQRHDWDLKNILGGIRDIEFVAQKAYLKNRPEIVEKNLISTEDFLNHAGHYLEKDTQLSLIKAYRFFLSVKQIRAVCYGDKSQKLTNLDLDGIAGLLDFSTSSELEKRRADYSAMVISAVEKFILK